MIELTPQERRLLVLAMGIISLQDLIQAASPDDDELVLKMEDQLDTSKIEFDALFGQIDQQALGNKLEGK